MTDRLIKITTALAVVAVACVAAIISYQHAYELVTSHGETGLTAHLLPFTVDGLIWAASMVVLDASRRHHPVPPLAKWSLAVGIREVEFLRSTSNRERSTHHARLLSRDRDH